MPDIRDFFGAKRASKNRRVVQESDEDEESNVLTNQATTAQPAQVFGKVRRSTRAKSDVPVQHDDEYGSIDLDFDEAIPPPPPPKCKRKQQETVDLEPSPKRARSTPSPRKPVVSPKQPLAKTITTPRKAAVPQATTHLDVQAILDAIPAAQPISTMDREAATKRAVVGKATAQTVTTGGSINGDLLPQGNLDCLLGLTFVFTGVLPTLERGDAQELVKKYGARVTTAPSKNTDFVVVGAEAGPNKIDKVRKLGVKMIDEAGLLQLISSMPAGGGNTQAAEKAQAKKDKEDEGARMRAKELEREQKEDLRKQAAQGARIVEPSTQLWTVKHAPRSLKDVVGNKANVERIVKFLRDFPISLRNSFRKGGADGMGAFRAVLVSGAPGLGKTTSAHLAAREAGYDVIELNASDTRSKKLLEGSLRGVVTNTSLVGTKRLVLIMDEVDGMSAGDRGGVGALNAVIRKTQIPIICICNDRSSPKLKPLDRTTFDIRFSRPTKDMVRSRIMTICYREGISITPQAADNLVEGTGGDLRQILNHLSTWRLTQTTLDQETATQTPRKHVVLKPWDICSRLLSSSRATVAERSELYFNDHEMSYLMLQENYLRTASAKRLGMASRAAASISDGDLVDAMIHGPQQHWSLMPVHAVFSCVRPASFVAGAAEGRYGFTSVLGNMSKTSKAYRLLREVRTHVSLKVSADRGEIRRDYIPAFYARTVKRVTEDIGAVIDFMDDYYISREDYDNLGELVIGSDVDIPSTIKAAFTRQYNKQPHNTPFIDVGSTAAPKRLVSADAVPDIEDAIEQDEEVPADDEEQEDREEDITKDKSIKVASKKTTAKSAAKRAGSSKQKK
ncbi:DNA replication factor C complex subunit Rfc1 [Savitreella phatthalungensis]